MARKVLAVSLGFLMAGAASGLAAVMQPDPSGAYVYVSTQDPEPKVAPTPKPPKAEKPERSEKTPRPAVAPMARAFAMAGGAGGSYLGIDIQDVTSDRMSSLKLKEERGCEITTVDQDAPAGKAGLKEHDVILDFNGQRVESEESLRRMLRETPAGRTVALGISRDGVPQQIKVTLGDRSKMMGKGGAWTVMAPNAKNGAKIVTIPDMEFHMPDIEIPQVEMVVRSTVGAGMMIDNLTPQLGEYFGVKGGEGVLVRSVEKGSAAETAGIKAGDVIVKINDEQISDRTDLRRALRGAKGKTNITVVREKREQTFSITLTKSDSSMKFDYDLNDNFDFDINAFDVDELESNLREKIRTFNPEFVNKIAKERVVSAHKAQVEADQARRVREFEERAKREMQMMQLREVLFNRS